MRKRLTRLLPVLIILVSLVWILSGVELPRRSGPIILGASVAVGILSFILLLAIGYRGDRTYYFPWIMVLTLLAFIAVSGTFMIYRIAAA